MKFTTIWTLPACSLKEKLRRSRDEVWRRVAHRLPKKLAYFSLLDTGARHIKGDEVVPAVPFMRVAERAGKGLDIA